MIEIHVQGNEAIERALKRFRKKIDRVKVLKELKARRFYTKPTRRRRDEKLKAIYKYQSRTSSWQ